MSGSGSGYLPGTELRIPLPMTGDLLGWSVKITWDIQTVQNNVLVTSKTKGGKCSLLDSLVVMVMVFSKVFKIIKTDRALLLITIQNL